ncbi:MAG: class I SAM-dependent methyltransferase [Candidatus Aenigmatarchaeota archaeon]
MFKYSTKTLEKVWNFTSNFWEELPSTSPNKKIEKFHKLEERFIVNFAKKYDKNIKILDLGCGTGRCLKVLRDNGFKKLFGIDISSKMLSKAKSKLSNSAILLKHDFRTKLPFETNYFDIILIAGNTLTSGGLIESDIALKQAYRVLKKNGFLIVGSYNAKFMTEDFVKRYYGNFPKELQFKRFDKKAKTVYLGYYFLIG